MASFCAQTTYTFLGDRSSRRSSRSSIAGRRALHPSGQPPCCERNLPLRDADIEYGQHTRHSPKMVSAALLGYPKMRVIWRMPVAPCRLSSRFIKRVHESPNTADPAGGASAEAKNSLRLRAGSRAPPWPPQSRGAVSQILSHRLAHSRRKSMSAVSRVRCSGPSCKAIASGQCAADADAQAI